MDRWVLHKWADEVGATASLPRPQIAAPAPHPHPDPMPQAQTVRTKIEQGDSMSKPLVASTSAGCPSCVKPLPDDAKACIFCEETLLCQDCEGNACPRCDPPTEPNPTPSSCTTLSPLGASSQPLGKTHNASPLVTAQSGVTTRGHRKKNSNASLLGTAQRGVTTRGQKKSIKLLQAGDWVLDSDICVWQEAVLGHNEVDEPRAWSMAAQYIQGKVADMRNYAEGKCEDGARAWCRRHFFICNSTVTQGEHWFVCAFDCKVKPEDFVVYIFEAKDTLHYVRKLIAALVKEGTQHVATPLGFQSDFWSCGYQSLSIVQQLVDHKGPLSAFQPRAMPTGFIQSAMEILNGARKMRVEVTPNELSSHSSEVIEFKPSSM